MSTVRVPCPTCGRMTEVDEDRPLGADFPFCTERCRLLDLGKWFDEEYRVEGRAADPSPDPGDGR